MERSTPHAATAAATPRWRRVVPTLATIAAVIVFVAAGNWQRGRLHEKEAMAQKLAAAEAAAPVPMARVAGDWHDWRFRVVEATGTFDARRQILLDNRVHAGRVGYEVVTPLALADGRTVLVNRGFVPAGRTRADLPAAPPPPGEVTIRGRLNLPPASYVELAKSPPAGSVWQNLDPARFAAATGLAVLPVVLEELDGPHDGLARDWPRPDVGSEKHRIYMMQWYAFAALAVALWIGLAWRHRR